MWVVDKNTDIFFHTYRPKVAFHRRRNLVQAINLIRVMTLRDMDLSRDDQCLIDSLPIPAVQFHLVPSSTGD
jgi:hypothetical protein